MYVEAALVEAINAYAEAHTAPEDPLLQKIQRETHAKVLYPRMLSGHLQGRVLALLSRLIQPKRILEIGTYTGYSALCLCEGLAPEGTLLTIDSNEELETFTRRFFEESVYSTQIDYRIGKALDLLPTLRGEFDLIFIDADKINYKTYYEYSLQRLRPGGLMLADNVLWSGKVVTGPSKPGDKDTKALIEFNRYVHEDPRVRPLLLPIRDGIMIAQKV
jgi:predicted O-methyltransferase YrrM